MFENSRGRIDAGIGHELPELLTGRGIHGGKSSVIAACEQQIPRGCDQSTIAAAWPSLRPQTFIGSQVHGRDNSCNRNGGKTHVTAGVAITRLG